MDFTRLCRSSTEHAATRRPTANPTSDHITPAALCFSPEQQGQGLHYGGLKMT